MSSNEKLSAVVLTAIVIYLLAVIEFKWHVKSKCLAGGYDRSDVTFNFKGYCIRGNVNPIVDESDKIKR